MNKTTFLTGFSKHLFGSSKRKDQASIRLKSENILKRSLGGFTAQFKSFIPHDFIKNNFTQKRERIFSFEVVFWAWMAQILDFNASCSYAVGKVQSWRLKAGLPSISSQTAAYCKARTRLPLELITSVWQQVIKITDNRVTSEQLWHGMVVKSVDGSSVQLMDTEENQKEYPQPSAQKKSCGFPVMKILGLLNHTTGLWEQCLYAHPNEHDARTMKKLIPSFIEPCLLLADRAFCSFEIMLRLKNQGVESVFRLHQMREKGYTLRKGKRLGKNDRLVTWHKPKSQPKHSGLTKGQWDALENRIEMRMVACWYEDRNGEKKRMIIATTLLDHKKYDWLSIVNIYAARWDMELRLRDVKTTMKMEVLNVKTPAMARKSMAMAILGYNLVKAVSQEAAIETGQEIKMISFKEVLDWVNTTTALFADAVKKSAKAVNELYRQFIQTVSTKRIVLRPHRWEPRRVKKRPKPFPRMQKSRQTYKEMHRNGDLIPALS